MRVTAAADADRQYVRGDVRSGGSGDRVWFALTAPAFAQEVEVLGPVGGGQAPVLVRRTLRVERARTSGRVQVLGRPAAGGAVTAVARATLPAVATARSPGGGSRPPPAGSGVRVFPREGKRQVLFGGPLNAALTPAAFHAARRGRWRPTATSGPGPVAFVDARAQRGRRSAPS